MPVGDEVQCLGVDRTKCWRNMKGISEDLETFGQLPYSVEELSGSWFPLADGRL